jgi:hypothetical protein
VDGVGVAVIGAVKNATSINGRHDMKIDLPVKVLPCPFCGSPTIIAFQDSAGSFGLGCTSCSARVANVSLDLAISEWQQRRTTQTVEFDDKEFSLNSKLIDVMKEIVDWGLYCNQRERSFDS